jgi:hypothetical protein
MLRRTNGISYVGSSWQHCVREPEAQARIQKRLTIDSCDILFSYRPKLLDAQTSGGLNDEWTRDVSNCVGGEAMLYGDNGWRVGLLGCV